MNDDDINELCDRKEQRAEGERNADDTNDG